jgi:hypothetical protein
MLYSVAALILLALQLLQLSDEQLTFRYPQRPETAISLEAQGFSEPTAQWRGTDYYYIGQRESDGMNLSVLFYKLTEEEVEGMNTEGRKLLKETGLSPKFPHFMFSNNDRIKTVESTDTSWTGPHGYTILRHADVNIQGITQKNFWAYYMPAEDIFVNVHVSMIGATSEDSLGMLSIMNSLTK